MTLYSRFTRINAEVLIANSLSITMNIIFTKEALSWTSDFFSTWGTVADKSMSSLHPFSSCSGASSRVFFEAKYVKDHLSSILIYILLNFKRSCSSISPQEGVSLKLSKFYGADRHRCCMHCSQGKTVYNTWCEDALHLYFFRCTSTKQALGVNLKVFPTGLLRLVKQYCLQFSIGVRLIGQVMKCFSGSLSFLVMFSLCLMWTLIHRVVKIWKAVCLQSSSVVRPTV